MLNSLVPYNIMWYNNCEVRYMYFVCISLQGTCSGPHRCTVPIGIYLQIFALALVYQVTIHRCQFMSIVYHICWSNNYVKLEGSIFCVCVSFFECFFNQIYSDNHIRVHSSLLGIYL